MGDGLWCPLTVSSSWWRFSHLCGGMYRGLLDVAGMTGVMGDGLWCPLTVMELSCVKQPCHLWTQGMTTPSSSY